MFPNGTYENTRASKPFISILIFYLVPALSANNVGSTVNFVVTNSDARSISMRSSASIIDLHREAAKTFRFPFELELLGKTITSSKTENNQSIDQIPTIISIMNEMKQIWGSNSFRIPLKLRRITRIPSHQDIAVYASLSRMFGGTGSNIQQFEWYRFITRCVERRSCCVEELCSRYPVKFKCQNESHLIKIDFERQHIYGYLNLSEIPRTVETLVVSRNDLNAIVGLEHTTDSNLKYLNIIRNPLDFDLRPLTSNNSLIPLKVLRVQSSHISKSLIGVPFSQWQNGALVDAVYDALLQWISTSSLDRIVLEQRHTRKVIDVNRVVTHHKLLE